MPEWAEIKLMSEFVNDASKDKLFKLIVRSGVNKNKMWEPFTGQEYSSLPTCVSRLSLFIPDTKLEAYARGKEMSIRFATEERSPYVGWMTFNMGMSGSWEATAPGHALPKHAHYTLVTGDDHRLSLVDARRFAKWRPGNFDIKRGPDPVEEHDAFLKNIDKNLKKAHFDLPICEVLLDQRYFNGIGNYLRAEICYHANQHPAESARDAIKNNPKLLELCKTVPQDAYDQGGGEIFTWKNPSGKKNTFKTWLKCYGKLNSFLDSNGRKMWTQEKI